MANAVEFTITKLQYRRGYVVEGEITVAGKIGADDFRQFTGTKREAELLRQRMILIETEAQNYVRAAEIARKAEALQLRADRNARKLAAPVQLNLI